MKDKNNQKKLKINHLQQNGKPVKENHTLYNELRTGLEQAIQITKQNKTK